MTPTDYALLGLIIVLVCIGCALVGLIRNPQFEYK